MLIKNEIYERVIKPGYNFVTIRPRRTVDVAQNYFIEWAKYLAENEVYFVFLYTIQNAPDGKITHLEKETVDEMKRIAGKYFVGDMIGETGSSVACKWPGYYEGITKNWDSQIGTKKHPDMKAAHDAYVKEVSKLIEIDRELGISEVVERVFDDLTDKKTVTELSGIISADREARALAKKYLSYS